MGNANFNVRRRWDRYLRRLEPDLATRIMNQQQRSVRYIEAPLDEHALTYSRSDIGGAPGCRAAWWIR